MTRPIPFWVPVLILVIAWPGCAFAREEMFTDKKPLQIDLDVFHSDNQSDFHPRIAIVYEPEPFFSGKEKQLGVGSGYLEGDYSFRFVHTWGSDVDDEPSVADLRFGLLWNLSRMKTADQLPGTAVDSLPDGPPVTDSGFVPVSDPILYNYGAVGLKAHFRGETDENADNVNLAAGIECAYSAFGAFQDRLLPLPSAWVALDYVAPQNAEARRTTGVDSSPYPRFRAGVLWNWPFGATLFPESPLGKALAFQLHYRYTRAFDQPGPWKDRQFDAYDQVDMRLFYHFAWPDVQRFGLRNLFLGYSSGRQIPHAANDNRVIFGITLQ